MRIEQMYDLIDSVQWFPVQLNTEVIFNNVMITDSTIMLGTGGGTRKKKDKSDTTAVASDSLVAESERFNKGF